MEALYYTDWKWAAMRGVLHTVGRASDGIALGMERGFDSGESMAYIYRNHPHGRYGIGTFADWVYLQQVGCRGLRGRKRLLKAALRDAIAANRAAGQPTHVLDVAAGAADYLLETFAEDGGADLSAECRDMDTSALRHGEAHAAELGLANVHFVWADAFDPAAFAGLSPAPNVVIVSGFYEILLMDESVQSSLALIAKALAPGGVLIFTTQVRHPQLEMIAHVLNDRYGQPWVMKLRSARLVEGWAREVGFSSCQTVAEPLGLFTVTTAHLSC
ncbi:MAG: class I SAM-dependent methyltransferase family protein [Anaerolineae bacterium]